MAEVDPRLRDDDGRGRPRPRGLLPGAGADAWSATSTALDTEYRRTLANCRVDTIVVSHDAFEYLGRRYGLDVVPIAGLEPDAEPSLQRLARPRRT